MKTKLTSSKWGTGQSSILKPLLRGIIFKGFIFITLLFSNHIHAQWEPVWQDEFNTGSRPDPAKWNHETGGNGWGNNELQYYANRPENSRIENGKLVIEARRDFFGGRDYSSARLKSTIGWTYGRMEIRAKLPQGRGTWPAIWMLPQPFAGGWPGTGEIDIMEHVGYDPGRIHGTVHTEAYNGMIGTQKSASTIVADFAQNFRNYILEWEPNQIRIYVDNVLYFTFNNEGTNATWPFNKNFGIILNIAVGGNWGGAMGVDPNIWPQKMEIDYVRVFKKGTTPQGDPNLAGTYRLQNRFSGLYMDVAGNSSNDGANIQQWTGNNCLCQQFTFTHLGNGTYKIIAKNSGKSLDVANFSTADGANILQWPYHGGDNQQFIVQSAGDGYYKIRGKQSNKLVEVGGWSTSAGGNVQQWSDANQSSGQWKLIPISTAFSKTIQAESYSAMAGVQVENTTDAGGGQNVGYIDAGDWMAYNSVNIPSSGAYTIEYRVASLSGGRLSADLNAGSIQLGVVNIPATGGWQNWTTVSHTVNINAGTYNFGIYAQTGGWNINWFRITGQNGAKISAGNSDDDNQVLPETSMISDLELYPNPVSSALSIQSVTAFDGAKYVIIDQMGSEISRGEIQQTVIDVSDLHSGLYTLLIIKDEKKIIRRFIKQD
ncbi:MAG: RICIN domain-containing protein [Cytophagaceae bacterium]|nr:RICIN domain-containing protein [Cytophagaceae bacterium]